MSKLLFSEIFGGSFVLFALQEEYLILSINRCRLPRGHVLGPEPRLQQPPRGP